MVVWKYSCLPEVTERARNNNVGDVICLVPGLFKLNKASPQHSKGEI